MIAHGGSSGLHPPQVAARVGAGLVGAGAALALLLTLTVPSYAAGGRVVVLAIAAVALLFGAVGLLVPQRMPARVWSVLPFAAAVVVGGAVVLSGGPRDGTELLLLWCVLYAAYFLDRWLAWLNVAVVEIVYVGADLLARHRAEVVAPATTLLLTSAVAVVLLSALRQRLATLLVSLRDEARQDPLTGLLNRRAFDELFERELQRRARTRRPLSLLSVDLDHFKRLNDSLGHPAGDLALTRAAEVLRSSLRDGDVVARVGGEEFAVLLVDCSVHDARRRAEQLRARVEALGDQLGHTLTTSVGVASVPRHAETAADVVAAADVALYRAKQSGRNRVEVAPLPLQPAPRLTDAEVS